jgi:hypothetical protein
MTEIRRCSVRERTVLWIIAVLGCVGLNGIFLYGTFVQPTIIAAAMSNPLAVAFIAEALVLTGLLAYLFAKWNVTAIPWQWFVLLALVGSLAFAVPVAVLWSRRQRARQADGVATPR